MNRQYDVVVVGGGVNGTGIAADAAGRGLSVLMCEAADLASATSSNSSKLIHGGLRYLEQYEFRLVREALAEREVLLAKAPHIMWPLRFRLPHQKHLRPAWMIQIGMFLYDNLAKRVSLKSSKRVKNTVQDPLVGDVKTCFEYSDGWVDDARLVVMNALAAQDQGATILTRTACTKAKKEGDLWSINLKDSSGTEFTVKAKALVNAAGPWAIQFLQDVAQIKNQDAMRLVKGSHFIVPRLFDSEEAYILQNADGRIVFVIPYEDDFTLVGTTDENFVGNPRDAAISQQETDYLIDIVNTYFKTKITQKDIVHSYSGVRPLLEEANASAQELTRDYKVVMTGGEKEPVLLNIFGGKITTFRKLSEFAVDTLVTHFPRAKKPWTKSVAFPGGNFESKEQLLADLAKEFPWLPTAIAKRYVRVYGTLCRPFLQNAKSLEGMGKDFGAGLYQSEVDYLVNYEWAYNADDILWRRTKLGLRMSKEQKRVLEDYVVASLQQKTA